MALVEAVSRLVPGMIGNATSTVEESFSDGLLEYPQYTRPETIRERSVPSILLSGDHAKIAKWRRRESLLRTQKRRPELFEQLELSKEDFLLLEDDSFEVVSKRRKKS